MMDLLMGQLENPFVNLKLIPLSLLSSLLFDLESQIKFFDKIMDVIEGNYDEKFQMRYIITLVKITVSNYHYFHN